LSVVCVGHGKRVDKAKNEHIKDLEYQLEQQKIMNPISVNMLATIETLGRDLKVAVSVLEMVQDHRKMPHQHEDYYLGLCYLTERASEALKEINGDIE
jgi:hypothetical protein